MPSWMLSAAELVAAAAAAAAAAETAAPPFSEVKVELISSTSSSKSFNRKSPSSRSCSARERTYLRSDELLFFNTNSSPDTPCNTCEDIEITFFHARTLAHICIPVTLFGIAPDARGTSLHSARNCSDK